MSLPDPKSSADLTVAVLCDFAQVREGLLFVSSACITRMWRAEEPCAMGVMLAMVVELSAAEVNRPHEFRVTVVNADTATQVGAGAGGFQIGTQPGQRPGESVQIPFVLDLRTAVLSTFGQYDLKITIDDVPARTLTFFIDHPSNFPGADVR